MKLLLTSAGIINDSIENALKRLVKGKIKIAFIPTAAMKDEDEEDKEWLREDLDNLKKIGTVEMVDISILGKKDWLSRLREANVIFFGGGDTSYLMKWILKSGLVEELPRLLKKRVYVGISAGSIVTSKEIQGNSEHLYGDETKNPPKGLGYVDFNIRPHLNSRYFPKINDRNLRKLSKEFSGDLYAIDDNSAILYNDGKIEIISEGKWIKYPKNS